MDVLFLIMMLVAVVLFVMTALGITGRPIQFIAAGLALWITVDIIRLVTTKF